MAETSEEFMEKYFCGEDFTYAEMIQGLRQGVKDLSLFPVVCGCAVSGLAPVCCWTPSWTCSPIPGGPPDRRKTPTAISSEFVAAPAPCPPLSSSRRSPDQYGKYSYVRRSLRQPEAGYAIVTPAPAPPKAGAPVCDDRQKADEVKELSCGDIGAIG